MQGYRFRYHALVLVTELSAIKHVFYGSCKTYIFGSTNIIFPYKGLNH